MNCSLCANALAAPRPNMAIASAVAVNIVLTLISSSRQPGCNRALLGQRVRGQPARRNPGAPPLGKWLNLNAVYRRFIVPCRPSASAREWLIVPLADLARHVGSRPTCLKGRHAIGFGCDRERADQQLR